MRADPKIAVTAEYSAFVAYRIGNEQVSGRAWVGLQAGRMEGKLGLVIWTKTPQQFFGVDHASKRIDSVRLATSDADEFVKCVDRIGEMEMEKRTRTGDEMIALTYVGLFLAINSAPAPVLLKGLSTRLIARENIEGYEVGKYASSGPVVALAGKAHFDGLVWTTRENVVVRIRASLIARGRTAVYEYDLRGLKVGPISPAFFERPHDYKVETHSAKGCSS